MYEIDPIGDAAEFMAITKDFRAAEPVLTNLPGTIVLGVLTGRMHDSYLYLVIRERRAIVGIAVRTAPWNLVVSPMPSEAARELGTALLTIDPGLPGINGPVGVVAAIYSTFRPGVNYRLAMSDVVYVLEDYVPPAWPAGRARTAVESDVELLVAWHYQFGEDAGVPIRRIEEQVPARVAAGHFLFWLDESGVPVAMGGHADPVDLPPSRIARIGPVYTPADLRGRGYGSAVTARLVEQLQRTCDKIMLFADADNRASNSIYRQLGFAAAAEVVETYLPTS